MAKLRKPDGYIRSFLPNSPLIPFWTITNKAGTKVLRIETPLAHFTEKQFSYYVHGALREFRLVEKWGWPTEEKKDGI